MKLHTLQCLESYKTVDPESSDKIKNAILTIINEKTNANLISPKYVIDTLKLSYKPNELPSYIYIEKLIKSGNAANQNPYNIFCNLGEKYKTKDNGLFAHNL